MGLAKRVSYRVRVRVSYRVRLKLNRTTPASNPIASSREDSIYP